jgi:hypothetical protein
VYITPYLFRPQGRNGSLPSLNPAEAKALPARALVRATSFSATLCFHISDTVKNRGETLAYCQYFRYGDGPLGTWPMQ